MALDGFSKVKDSISFAKAGRHTYRILPGSFFCVSTDAVRVIRYDAELHRGGSQIADRIPYFFVRQGDQFGDQSDLIDPDGKLHGFLFCAA